MPSARLTQALAESAKPGDFLCDDKTVGLMLIAQKRVKTWAVQREVKDPLTGLRKTARVKLGHFPALSVQEARELAKDELRKMEKGKAPVTAARKALTLREAAEEFLEGAVTLRPRTIEGYRFNLDHYFCYRADKGATVDLRSMPLRELGDKPILVKNLYTWLTKNKSKAIAVGAMRTLSTIYSNAMALDKELPLNPVRSKGGVVKLHKLPKRKTRIQEDEFNAWADLFMTMNNPIRRALRLFLLLTGQREEATCKMRWEHIDFRPGKESIHFPDPKGGPDAAFDLPLGPQVVDILKYVKTFSEEPWAYPGSPWVWPADSASGHVEETKETNPKRKALLSAHPMRRTFISEGYEVAPNKLVSFIANHACRDNITDDYFVPSTEAVRRALTNIDAALLEKLGYDLVTLLGPKVFSPAQFPATVSK